MASEPGEVLVPFPETQTQKTDADLQRVCDPRVAALGPLRRLLRVAAAGAVQSATRDAICIPPPSCRLAGAGVSPAAEAYSWQRH